MTGKARRSFAPEALLPAVVALGLLVLVWAATAGPVAVMSASGRTVRFGGDAPSPVVPSESATSPGTLREATEGVRLRFDLGWLGDLIAYGFFIGVGVLAFLAARWLWRNRWHPPGKPARTDFVVLPDEAVAAALAEDLDAQVAAVGEGTVRNGIVACWLRLEQVMTSAGVRPHPSDTSAEFAVRVLHSLDVDPRPVGRLAALYREARFSEHELGEGARSEARSALEQLHDDLRQRSVLP